MKRLIIEFAISYPLTEAEAVSGVNGCTLPQIAIIEIYLLRLRTTANIFRQVIFDQLIIKDASVLHASQNVSGSNDIGAQSVAERGVP